MLQKNIKFLNDIYNCIRCDNSNYKESCKRYFSQIKSNTTFSADKCKNVDNFLNYHQKTFILYQINIISYLINYIILNIEQKKQNELFKLIKDVLDFSENEYIKIK